MLAFAALCGPASGLAVPLLGVAESFTVAGGSVSGSSAAGGSLVTNTGTGSITGYDGVSATSSITGSGTIPFSPSGSRDNLSLSSPSPFPSYVTSLQAQAADTIAYDGLKPLPCSVDRTEANLSELALGSSLHCFLTTAGFDGASTSNAVVNASSRNSTTGSGFESLKETDAASAIGFTAIEGGPAAFLSEPLVFTAISASLAVGSSLVASIPEPSTLVLLGFGLAILTRLPKRR